MHRPFIPSLSPFTLAEDSCSSHGFSSLQSPSEFPSFFSDDGCQQIETFQPLSLDSAELCACRRRHRCGDAALDITQDDSVSASNLNIFLSEKEPVSHHTDPQNLVCPFHSSSNKTSSRNCEAVRNDSWLDCIQRGSLLEEDVIAKHSLPSYASSRPYDTESSASLIIQDRYNAKEQPVFELNWRFLSSSRHQEKHSAALLPSNDISHVYSNSGAGIDAHATQSCCRSSCIMPSEIVPSLLRSPVHTLSTRHGDADDKENFREAHITGSRERPVQLSDNLSPPCSVEAKLIQKREDKDALQEVHRNKKAMYPPCTEVFLYKNAVDEASKENISPHVSEQAHKRVGGAKADSNGWMCPKDAKKNFKPKPRQLLLDKWLVRQR